MAARGGVGMLALINSVACMTIFVQFYPMVSCSFVVLLQFLPV